VDDQDARAVEESRKSFREWLAGPDSYLAAIARHELPVGNGLRFGVDGDVPLPDSSDSVTVAATGDGFLVDGVPRGPGIVRLGRYGLRLSHQNAPAVVVLDAQAPRAPIAPRWYPYDPAFRFVAALEGERTRIELGSTRKGHRSADRVGWIRFVIAGGSYRLAVMRLAEPGVSEASLEVFFRDRTSGRDTYGLGRYVDLEAVGSGRYVLDFNRAYNPACAYSPHYNCPIPPDENSLTVAIAAGEMTPA
jgi:uncharacterized protein (DUF1684 family)